MFSILLFVHHFIFFGLDRARIHEDSFLQSKAEGAQLKYTWRELEPEKGRYDFSAIRKDLAFLEANQKKLFVQLQDVSFDAWIVNVPEYLKADPQYEYGEGQEDKARVAGWVARRWDPATREQFHLLLDALGKEFDGRIAGINLPETAVEFGESGKHFPSGFTFENYRDGILDNMAALKRAFPKSVAMQYANFMPGEWLPSMNNHYLESVYDSAQKLGVSPAGPDLFPWKKGQMNHSYKLLHDWTGNVPPGIAVQEGNYAYVNPKTGKRITTKELLSFATDYLHAGYIFWFAEAPYYQRDVLPLVNR